MRSAVTTYIGSICMAFLMSGCSWIFMSPPPDQPSQKTLESCDRAWPIVMDIVAVAMSFQAYAGTLFEGASSFEKQKDLKVPIIFAIAFGLPALTFGASAITGGVWKSRCNEVKEQLKFDSPEGNEGNNSPENE